MRRCHAALAVALALPLLAVPSSAGPGAVWLPTLASTENFQRLSLFPNGVGYAQVDGNYAVTRDFGLTWQRRPQPGQPPALVPLLGETSNVVRFATPAVGYAMVNAATFPAPGCAETSLMRTADGGDSWTPLCLPPGSLERGVTWAVSPITVAPGGLTVVLTGIEYEGGTTCADLQGVAYTSVDGGATWVRALLATNTFPAWSVDVYDAGHAAMVAYHRADPDSCDSRSNSNAVLYTSDGGVTWATVRECGSTPLCTTVALPEANRLLVGMSDGSTTISVNGGVSFVTGPTLGDLRWDLVVERDPAAAYLFWVQSFAFADAQHGFASTRGAGTWRTSDGGATWVQEASQDCTYVPLGVGEVVAASPDRALVGSSLAVSTRLDAPGAPSSCVPVAYRFAALGGDEPIVHTPTVVVSADASVQFHLG